MLCAWARCYSACFVLRGDACMGLDARCCMSVPVQSHVEDRGKDKTHKREKQNDDEEEEVVEREEEEFFVPALFDPVRSSVG